MTNEVDIIEFEDPSVTELLNKTAKDLHKKYTKQRKLNKKFLNKKTPTQKVLSVVFDVVCVLMLLVAGIVCFSTINSAINGYMPNFAGYTNLVVSSESMVASGYEVGDIVIIHSVDTDTLNVNDKISFYVYWSSSFDFEDRVVRDVSDQISKTKYTLKFGQLFGFQTKEVEKAIKSNSKLVFHHISAIYEDENGERWFKTYGSSNQFEDSWWVNEKYVVGIEDDGIVSKSVIGLVGFAAKPNGILIMFIPVIVLLLILVLSFLKNIQIAKLELDCVEEKRKITDDICVKNKVGYQMSNKTKYKILAQATDENRNEYIKLLWKDGTEPDAMKKYYRRQKLLVNTNEDLLNLNRTCEKMFKQGENPKKIAQLYLSEKAKIEKRRESIQNRLKSIDRHKRELMKEQEARETNKKVKAKKANKKN